MKKFLQVVAVLVFGVLAGLGALTVDSVFRTPAFNATPKLPKIRSIKPSKDATIPHIIQLHQNGQFVCSGAVFDAQYAVTAGHCNLTTFMGALNTIPFEIKDSRGRSTGVTAIAAGAGGRTDFGIIKGDFRKFKQAKLDVVNNQFFERVPFVTCGFPYGQNRVTCTPFVPQRTMGFFVAGQGALVPGMSGGPVYNAITDEVVGVNSAVGEGEVYVTALTGLYGAFGIDR